MSGCWRKILCAISLLLTAPFEVSSLAQLMPVLRFNLRKITQMSYIDSIIETKDSLNGSDMVCGAMCRTSPIKCTAFNFDGNQCHFLRSWSLITESDPASVNGVDVYQMNVNEVWSKVMILGGKISENPPTAGVEVIDLVNAKHCDSPPSLPNGRFGMPSFVLGSKLLVIGGIGAETEITSYNYDTHVWETVGNLPQTWVDYSLGRIQDSWILLMGGQYDGAKTDMTIILNADDSMVPGPNLPGAMKGFCSCGLDDNHIFIAGGKTTVELNTAHVLDWNNQQWTALDPMAFPRYYVECDTFLSSNQELSILVVGGLYDDTDPDTEIFNWPLRSWRAGPDFAFPKIYLTRMIGFDKKLFLFGGHIQDTLTLLSSIYVFTPANESWVRFPLDLSTQRRDFGVMLIPDGIVDC